MADKENSVIKGWPVYLVFAILLIAVIWALKNQPSGSSFQGSGSRPLHPADIHVHEAEVPGEPKSMAQIIRARRTWNPVWKDWYGKEAADFELQDITGKTHKLSDYRGKDVLLIFWATWCAPCRTEVPHLKELRKRISEDELAMLAISSEGLTILQRYAKSNRLNYTVLAEKGTLPAPFNGVRGIPAGFFVDKEGNIKLATEGLVSLTELLQILRSKG
ncbi:MAG: peroxiredoxin family protein [Planctomycetota bacterium]|jgi:peroxiredoxin